jgi:hypothetical protein
MIRSIFSQSNRKNVCDEKKDICIYCNNESCTCSKAQPENILGGLMCCSTFNCCATPNWKSMSFACGGWLQFYEFGIKLYFYIYF